MSLASSGVIYNRGVEELPLPDPLAGLSHGHDAHSALCAGAVTAAAIQEMPQGISKMLDQIGHTDYAVLSEAIMPFPDGTIKDWRSGLQDPDR